MIKKRDRFVCWLPCKPYVKEFLLANFNAPDEVWDEIVDLSPDRELQADFWVDWVNKGAGKINTAITCDIPPAYPLK